MIFNFKRGFGILEILVVLAILTLIILVVLPSFAKIRERKVLDTAVADVVSALDKAKSYSLSSVDSSEYGVHFESSQIVIFKGTVYSSMDVNNENILVFSPAYISDIGLTGGASDIYFDRLSGVPSKTGTITVTSSSVSKTITISVTGAISVN